MAKYRVTGPIRRVAVGSYVVVFNGSEFDDTGVPGEVVEFMLNNKIIVPEEKPAPGGAVLPEATAAERKEQKQSKEV